MTSSEQAALLAKHRADRSAPRIGIRPVVSCLYCQVPFPCDVHKMAELKDAEIAELNETLLMLDTENETRTQQLENMAADRVREREAIVDWLQQTIDRPDNAEYGMVEYAQELIDFIRSFSPEGER